MKSIIPFLSIKSVALALSTSIIPSIAHDHFAVGIADSNNNGEANAGEQLQLTGTNWSNRTFHLLPRPVGQRCGGYYNLSESVRTLYPLDTFSITALSDGQYDLASPDHAHTGAWIWAEIVSVTGPAGANFGYWDEGATVVGYSLATNQPTGNPRFVISEGNDNIDDDPSGHIHGRAWTADKPGDYLVGIRFVDLSTTGPSGAWHTPSQTYIFKFQAGPSFQPTLGQNTSGSPTLTWPCQMGIWKNHQSGVVFTIQRSTTLSGNDWQSLGTVTGTTADTLNFTDPSPPVGKAFYRLAFDWANP